MAIVFGAPRPPAMSSAATGSETGKASAQLFTDANLKPKTRTKIRTFASNHHHHHGHLDAHNHHHHHDHHHHGFNHIMVVHRSRRRRKLAVWPPSWSLFTLDDLTIVLLLLFALLMMIRSQLELPVKKQNGASKVPLGCEARIITVRIGALFEQSDHEQANMFIRTIKMINERKDDAIRQLLNVSLQTTAFGRFRQPQPQSQQQAHDLQLPHQKEPQKEPQNENLGQNQAQLQSQSQPQSKRPKRNEQKHPPKEAQNEHKDKTSEPDDGFYDHQSSLGNQTEFGARGQRASNRMPRARDIATDAVTDTDTDRDDSATATGTTNSNSDADDATTASAAVWASSGWPWSPEEAHRGQQRVQIRLEPMIELLDDPDSAFEADEKACKLLESGARAILGPLRGASIAHVQSVCDTMEVPYFTLRPLEGSLGSTGSSGDRLHRPLHDRDAHEVSLVAGQPQLQPQVAASGHSNDRHPDTDTDIGLQLNMNMNLFDEQLALNLHPPAQMLTNAYIDLIYACNWSSFAIVYDQDSSMVKLQSLFKESSGSWTSRWRIKLYQFDSTLKSDHQSTGSGHPRGHNHAHPANSTSGSVAAMTSSSSASASTTSSSSNANSTPASSASASGSGSSGKFGSFRDIFWRIKKSRETNVLVDVGHRNLFEALKQAQQVGCMTEQFSYLVSSLDLHTVDMENFKYGRSKITSFNMLHLDLSTLAASSSNSDSNYAQTNQKLDYATYLEKLGFHVRSAASSTSTLASSSSSTASRLHPKEAEQPASGESPPDGEHDATRLFELYAERSAAANSLAKSSLTTASAVIHDSLVLFALALEELEPSAGSPGAPSTSLSCGHASRWPHGLSLVNYMRQLQFVGLTGPVALDSRNGQRAQCALDLVGLAPEVGTVKLGEWRPSSGADSDGSSRGVGVGVNATQAYVAAATAPSPTAAPQTSHRQLLWVAQQDPEVGPAFDAAPPSTSGRLVVNELMFERMYAEHIEQVDTLIVTSKLSQPYFMLKETPNKLEGNEQYEGFAVDLIHELSKLVNFRYKWREVADNKYGSSETLPNGTVVWNGMIGEIVRGVADVAIVDLTITSSREEAVDFTLPFMNTGISILFKKPTTKVTTLYSFLSPFSRDVWAYVLGAYCSISGILFFVGHLSPYEWEDPHPCPHAAAMSMASASGDQDEYDAAGKPREADRLEQQQLAGVVILRNQFSLPNSFWFTIGSLMQQGSDLTPRSMSTRTIAGIWYFFTLIMISSYTANLAAFLTVERVVYPIENVRDLANQNEIRYGCVESGSTCSFFRESQIDTYKRINATVTKHQSYVKSNAEGQKRVEEGKFAFFMESASIEYIIERNCNLTQIGGTLDSKGYGLATSKRPRYKRPYRTLLSEGILRLQETGMLHVLKNRWWKERRGGGTCTDDAKGGGVTELSLANVGGVFVVLVGGLCIAFLVALAEFVWRAHRDGRSMCSMVKVTSSSTSNARLGGSALIKGNSQSFDEDTSHSNSNSNSNSNSSAAARLPNTRNSLCDQMMSDLMFAINCTKSVKTISRERLDAKRQSARLLRMQSSLSYSYPSRSESPHDQSASRATLARQPTNQQAHGQRNQPVTSQPVASFQPRKVPLAGAHDSLEFIDAPQSSHNTHSLGRPRPLPDPCACLLAAQPFQRGMPLTPAPPGHPQRLQQAQQQQHHYEIHQQHQLQQLQSQQLHERIHRNQQSSFRRRQLFAQHQQTIDDTLGWGPPGPAPGN